MKFNKIYLAVGLLSSVLLSGCATDVKDCDPNSGDVSIVTKFNCQYSGTYQKRIDDKKIILENETALNAEFKATMAELEKEIAAQRADLNQANSTNSALKAKLNQLLATLKAKTTDNAQIQASINAIQDEIENANPNASVIEKQIKLEELRSKLSSLEADLGLAS
ncbi:hypothetical protein [Thorsellia anophelis]|uniref:Lipoprotein n=1 Tax=Thorsellia anophelis DSM 18579 TaxID=1123402 RepID=A0A1H9ZR48_9GAMM|nr:hypothetical protein [Thorsellia anophelis]SES84279.1 hypothetical protein SAMN02583745_00663 [Thorsellia anophelis DSM 18579]